MHYAIVIALVEGGKIIALKQKLLETIELYGCEEYLGSVFEDAERNTDVTVSMVKLYKEGEGVEEFADYICFQMKQIYLMLTRQKGLYNIMWCVIWLTAISLLYAFSTKQWLLLKRLIL